MIPVGSHILTRKPPCEYLDFAYSEETDEFIIKHMKAGDEVARQLVAIPSAWFPFCSEWLKNYEQEVSGDSLEDRSPQ